MSLPIHWVDRIFDKLTLTYGQAFLSRWRDIDLNSVKSDWCHELAVFERSPHSIAFALSNLPERPPSVVEFKALCRQAPQAEVKALETPKADPERLRNELQKLGHIKASKISKPANRDWAYVIIKRYEGGAAVSPTVLSMAREAILG